MNFMDDTYITLDVNIMVFFCTLFAGLLSGFDSKRFDSIFATVKTTKSAKADNVDDEFSITTWTRRFGATV